MKRQLPERVHVPEWVGEVFALLIVGTLLGGLLGAVVIYAAGSF